MLKKGIAASSGIAIAKALVYEKQAIDCSMRPIENAEMELKRFEDAQKESKIQLQEIYEKALSEIGEEEAAIFDAHIMVLEDPEFSGGVRSQITEQKSNAEYAVKTVTENIAGIFESMEDPYFAARAADMRDVGDRVIHNLAGVPMVNLSDLSEDVIIVAEDLTPSDTARMDKNHVKGIATELGSRTAHTAIMARSLDLPAVVGLGEVIPNLKNGDIIIVDGIDGDLIYDPEQSEIDVYETKLHEYLITVKELYDGKDLPAETTDGYEVEVAGNIGNPSDVDAVLRSGGKSVGLYRTEFLFMDSPVMPDEETQFEAYKKVAEALTEGSVIIRTMDIGGDKKLPYLPMDDEMNPFLGLRAVRLSFANRSLFKTQLRAILRASAYGNIRVMFPMVSGIDEVRQAKNILWECMDELRHEGLLFDENLKVGVMIEIPSAALTADLLVNEVDFFSIGTNDLCQYTLAVDRMNEKVSYLYDPLHPAVLRLIQNVIKASETKPGCFTGMCGEMASDPIAALILLGMGLKEFSMSAASIPMIKKVIRSFSYSQTKALADKAMTLEDGDAIRTLADKMLKDTLRS